MKAKYLLILAILALFVATASAQNKIGDNPTTVNAASLLELESTNKGVLLPRVNLAAINTWSPLTGTAINGMLIYNSNATIGQGFYYWNTTLGTWVRIANTTENPSTLNGIVAATGTNAINNTNFAQTWNWSTLGATTAFTLANTGAITTGTVLAISQGTAGNSGLRFTNLNSASTNTTNNYNQLQVNATGDVVKVASSGSGYYVGDIRYVYSTTAPAAIRTETDGSVWFYANGQAVNAGTYPTSPFAGAAIPDLRDRVLANYSGMNAINTNAGAATHTNTVAEMATHSHGINDPGHTHMLNTTGGSGTSFAPTVGYAGSATGSSTTGITIQNNGSNAAWDIRQPTYYCAIYIRIL